MNERERVLRLLAEGKITVEQAARLLDALDKTATGEPRNRHLKIRVQKQGSDRPKVNITLPIGLVKLGMGFVPDSAKAKLEDKEIDLAAVAEALARGVTGKLVDVEDEENGEHVEVWVE